MSLKINRQVDLETLFNKFALDPLEPPKEKKQAEQDVSDSKATSTNNKTDKKH